MKSLRYLLSFEKSDISIFQPTTKKCMFFISIYQISINFAISILVPQNLKIPKTIDCFRNDSSFNQHVWIKYDHLIFPKGFHSQWQVVPDFYQLSTPGKTHCHRCVFFLRGNHQLLMISTKRTTVRRRSTLDNLYMGWMDVGLPVAKSIASIQRVFSIQIPKNQMMYILPMGNLDFKMDLWSL